MAFLHYIVIQVPAKIGWILLCAILAVLMFSGCESPSPPPHGVNITLNGKPVFVHPGAKIVTRDPMTGRFIAPRVIEP